MAYIPPHKRIFIRNPAPTSNTSPPLANVTSNPIPTPASSSVTSNPSPPLANVISNPAPTSGSSSVTSNPSPPLANVTSNPARTSGSSSTSNPSPPLANGTSQTPSSPHKIPYSRRRFITRWYATSSTESLAVAPYAYETIDSNPLIVKVTDEAGLVEKEEIGVLRGIVEKLARDLIKASQHAEEKEIENVDDKQLMMEKIEIVNVQLLVMVGKVLLLGEPSVCLDSIKNASASEGELNKEARKTFYSRVSEDYIRQVEQLLVEKCGFKFERAKERYHIKVRVKRTGNLIYSCNCKPSDDSTHLELYKVEQTPLKHMVTDVSCLSKNFDIRIMLNTKRALKNLDADVVDSINQLISSAVIDPEAKGGLRWPSGKESVDGRFVVVGVWHTKHTILSRDKIRVGFRQARRFDFTKSTDEDVNDISFKLRGLSEILTEEHLRDGSIVDMILEVVDLIWDNLLSLSYLYTVES